MKKFITIFYLIYLLSTTLNAQTDLLYESGQLFAQVKSEKAITFSAQEILKRPSFQKFKISEIKKAFKINEDPLNRIYLITFDEYSKIDLLLKEFELTGLFNYVEKVPIYHAFYTPNDLNSAQWNLKKILAENAWDIRKGSSKIVIAIVDDAMDTAHPDLEPVVWRNIGEIRGNGIDDDGNGYVDDYIGWDAADNDNDPSYGGSSALYHGTHCSGIAGAATNNSKGIASIGFGCRLMISKIGYPYYDPRVGKIVAGIRNDYQGVEYAIINKANVISMSWGGPGYSSVYQSLFDIAYKKGIVCVAAAGNYSDSNRLYPAAYNHIISVGSTTSADKISSFSNFGKWVDVMAPGSGIYSTLPNNKYGYLDGTSMATPLVAGLCGLMFSQNPNATPGQIEACLKSGCDNIYALNSAYSGLLGAGRINAENSLRCLKSINAAFSSNVTMTCTGDTIQFFDNTVPKPTALKWKFTGGSPASSFSSNPKIKYNTTGTYDVELIVFDSTSSDTLLKKKYITIAVPSATLSLNRTIVKGNSTTIRIDFTGNAPYKVTISEGTISKTISNIAYSPYFHVVSPIVTTTYALTAFSEKKCSGTFSGSSKVTVTTGPTTAPYCLKVNSLSKISSTTTGFTGLLDDGDYFGQTVRNFGDFDGDGVEDLIAGAQNDDDGGSNQGAVYIILLKSDGSIKSKQKISATTGGFTGSLSGSNYFGSGVSKLKDLNGDGINDLVVGHIYNSSVSSRSGGVWIIFLNANGTVKSQQLIASGVGGFPAILDPDDNFGCDVNEMGDLDGDGNTDIIVGAPYDDDGGTDRGAVYIIYLKNDGTVKSYKKICSGTGGFSGSIANSDAFGYSVSGPGDLNYDGIDDVVVGARLSDDGGTNKGAAWILYLNGSQTVTGQSKISATSGSFTGTLDNDDQFGNGVDIVGDVNNDGFTDIAVSACYDDDGGTDRGAVWLLLLNKTGSVSSYVKISSTAQNILKNKLDNDDLMGWRVSVLNDIDGDGQKEIVCGAMRDDDGGTDRGAVYILNLKDTCTPLSCLKLKSYTKISSTKGNFGGSLDNDDRFGHAVQSIGDVDGDGIIDVAVNAQLDDDGGTNYGAIYILFMKKDGTVRAQQKISATQGGFSANISNGIYFGMRLTGIGDLNNDGVPDIVASHAFDNSGGSVFVLFLNSNGTVKSYQKIGNGNGSFTGTINGGDRFGVGLCNLGDFDGDGVNDLGVGAQGDADAGTQKGAFYILYLNTNGTVKSHKKISPTQGGFTGTLNTGDNFGFSITTIGDYNKDGIVDLAVGARNDGDGGSFRGAVWILFMNSNGTVKSYQKISSLSGNFSGALDDADNFGVGVDNIGDLNGDGRDEIVVAANYDDDNGTDKGTVYVLYLNSSGTVNKYSKLNDLTQGFKGNLDNDDWFGYSIGTAKDITGDGYPEILVGAINDDDGGSNRGAVYILNVIDSCYLIPTTCLKLDSINKISSTKGGFKGTLTNGDRLGYGGSGIGDLDGDGVKDMAIGAPYDNDGGSLRGAVWLHYMNADNSIKSIVKISSNTTNFTSALADGDLFGIDIAAIGDMDNDGVTELLVGAIGDDNGGSNTGAAYILYMNNNGSVKSYRKIGSGLGGFTGSIGADYGFGISVDQFGDFDKDGVKDIIIGSYKDPDGGTRTGAVWIITMKANGTVKNNYRISESTIGMGTSTLDPNDYFGTDISYLGDVNGDGISDFAATAIGDDDGGTDRGALYYLNINSNATIKKISKISSITNGFNGNLKDNDGFGYAMESIMVSSSKMIFLVTSSGDDDGGTDIGASYVIETGLNFNVIKEYKYSASNAKLSGQLDNNDIFGSSAFLLKTDLSNGNFTVGVGAQFDDDGGTDRGALYLLNFKDTCAIISNPKCNIKADFSYKFGCTGDTFKFKDVSIDNDKVGIIKWEWSFGDGTTAEGKPEVGHPFNTSGTRLVKLVVYANGNTLCKDSVTRPVNVNKQLRVLGLLDDTICIADSAQLGVGQLLCGVPPFTYLWQPSTGISNNKILNPKASPGGNTKYTLIITDNINQKAYDTLIVKVDSNCCKSYPLFKVNHISACERDTFIINNQSVVKAGAVYSWKITPAGNYSTFTGKNPPPLFFNKSGAYKIRLILNDLCGTDTVDKVVYVLPTPKVDAGRDTFLCKGDSLLIGQVGLGLNQYFWTPSVGLNADDIPQPMAHFTNTISYIVKMISEAGCIATDTITISKIIEPKLNIGPDTLLCKDSTFVLKSNINSQFYLWNDGSKLSSLKVITSGTYWLEAKDKCLQRDSATINLKRIKPFSLGRDTLICQLTSLLLKSNINSGPFVKKWENGATTDTRNINKTGTYWLTLGNGSCELSDTINVEFSKKPFTNLGRDTVLCSSSSMQLNATDSFATSYLWNDGDIKPVKIIKTSGIHKVTLTNKCGTYTDSVKIEFSKKPYAYLGPDTIICSTGSILVNATDTFAISYLWNDGDIRPVRTLSLPGRYGVAITSKCGSYQTFINIGNEKPAVPFLGADKIAICIGDTITLNATNGNTKYYLWEDGSSKPIRKVNLPGKYTIQMGNICGDFDTSVNVEANNCDCDIFVPNTFTPINSNGVNDLFKPVVPMGCEPAEYQLNIYNRWGELIFMSNDYNEGWNGDYQGKKVINGNYTWMITMRYNYTNNGKRFIKTGNLLIIE